MLDAKIMRLFILFSGVDCAEQWRDIVESAILHVRAELKPEADENDLRLAYYTAAYANCIYRRLMAAREGISPSYAGHAAARKQDVNPCAQAEQLMLAYRCQCASLLQNDLPVFFAV